MRIENDEWGEHQVIKKDNGVTVKVLTKPSQKYKDKMKARNDVNKIREEAERKRLQKDSLIQDKLKQNAIAELIADGTLDENGELIG